VHPVLLNGLVSATVLCSCWLQEVRGLVCRNRCLIIRVSLTPVAVTRYPGGCRLSTRHSGRAKSDVLCDHAGVPTRVSEPEIEMPPLCPLLVSHSCCGSDSRMPSVVKQSRGTVIQSVLQPHPLTLNTYPYFPAGGRATDSVAVSFNFTSCLFIVSVMSKRYKGAKCEIVLWKRS
jgi:hypothetical protein